MAVTSMASLPRSSSPNEGDVSSASDSSSALSLLGCFCWPLARGFCSGFCSASSAAPFTSSTSDMSSSLSGSDEISIVSACELRRASAPATVVLDSSIVFLAVLLASGLTTGVANLAGVLLLGVDMADGRGGRTEERKLKTLMVVGERKGNFLEARGRCCCCCCPFRFCFRLCCAAIRMGRAVEKRMQNAERRQSSSPLCH
ncbi:hypothetical protein V8C44DRAFT_340397 [Trichoderma aethiopicum]